MSESAFEVFERCPKYKGKTVAEHVGDLVYMPESEMQGAADAFFKILATWVFRKLTHDRRKEGVPLGFMKNFVLADSVKIDLTETLVKHLVRIWRKRGLEEFDRSRPSPTFEELVRAFDRAQRR